MWLQLNKFYLMVNSAAEKPEGARFSFTEFFSEVKNASHLFTGVAAATMTHGEAWHFARLGRTLERADKTSRILDVKYFILLRSVEDVGTPFDDIQWTAVLRSASAFEVYRMRYGRMSPRGVVDFLLLDRDFPRAIHYCLLAARDSLHAISGTPSGTFRHPPEKLLGQLCSDLSFTSVDEIIERGLHQYLGRVADEDELRGCRHLRNLFRFQDAAWQPESRKCPSDADANETHRHPDRRRRYARAERRPSTAPSRARTSSGLRFTGSSRASTASSIRASRTFTSIRSIQEIPELDPTKGGTLIGSSRDYVDPNKKDELDTDCVAPRLCSASKG